MVSTVGAGVREKAVGNNGVVVRKVLVCAEMFRYIFSSSSAANVSGAVASVFGKVSLARTRNAVNSSPVRIRKEESEFGLMSSVT